jgi:hypothetical protein
MPDVLPMRTRRTARRIPRLGVATGPPPPGYERQDATAECGDGIQDGAHALRRE